MSKRAQSLAVRFWAKVGPADENGCRRWAGYHNPVSGYGQVSMAKADVERFGARVVTAPVVSCTLAHGPKPPGLVVLHSCDNSGCCAPEHLRWGSMAENNREAWDRGRQRWGEDHHQATLTDDQLIALLVRAQAGESVYELAAEHGVCWSTVYHWLSGKGRGRILKAVS